MCVQNKGSLLDRLEYEFMLLSRYQQRPHHNAEPVLDRSAFILLSRLENVPPMTLKELAAALRLDASTVHRQVASLLRNGHGEYAAGDGSEVARRVAPTPVGRAALAATRASYRAGLERVMDSWPEERRQQFLQLLLAFNQDVELMEGSPWPRSE